MWVLKLGGSLLHGDLLGRWVERLASSGEPLVVVPGGGPFADQVRRMQRRWPFDDLHAHAMALLAMEQTGLMLCGLDHRLVACDDNASIIAALADGRTPVWMASRQVLAEQAIAADWSVTSDSLALWLARELGADGVVLVKSAALPAGGLSIRAAQRRGLVDAGFDHHAGTLDCPVVVVNRSFDGPIRRLFDSTCRESLRLA